MMRLASRIKQALGSVGAYRAWLASHSYPGVAVLAYHGVRPDSLPDGSLHLEELHVRASRLDAHCRMLRALGCSPLSFTDWCDIAAGRRPLPPRAVMLTFDDGYRSVLTEALPVLERHAMPATVFVCTGPVERQVRFWFDALAERRGHDAVAHAKTLAYDEWRDAVTRDEMRVAPDDPHAPLTITEVRQLSAHPLVAIGAHTETHPMLARAPERVQREEIQRSRASLEAWLGRPVTAFAYPNGRPGEDFTTVAARAVADAGFAHAFAIRAAFANPADGRYGHPRFMMLDAIDAAELAHRLAVTWARGTA